MKRKIIYGLLAALVSFGLWMYVVTVVNPEWEDTFYNIPVVLENEEILQERGLMLISEEAPKVTLRLSGNRADMINLNASNITLRADLSRIYSAGEQSLGYSIIYPDGVPNNAFEIISQTPQQITLSVAERTSKDVDVQVVFNGNVPEQYIAFKDEAVLDYAKIAVAGPADIVNKIAMAKVEVDLENQKETFSQQYSYVFCDAEGNVIESDWLTTNTQQVQYKLKIQQWKDITLRVDVIDGGGLTQAQSVPVTTDTIRVAGSEKQLADLGDELVIGTINLGEILKNEVLSFPIELPEGITNLSEQDSMDVEVKVELPGITTKTLEVTRFEEVDVPAGMQVTLTAKKIKVTVRGPKELLNRITEKDLVIKVYFTGAQAGTDQFEAKVVVTNPDLAAKVGAMDIDNLNATVTAMSG